MSYYKIRPRSGTANQWSTANPVLKEREIGYEVPDGGVGTGNVKMKMGDGITPWNDLPYAIPNYLSADDIVQNATTDSETKVPSAKVAKDLQDQITKQNDDLAEVLSDLRESIDNGIAELYLLYESLGDSVIQQEETINTLQNSLNTTNKKVATMNYASVSQIEGFKQVTLEAGKKGSVAVTIDHASNVSLVGLGALTVSSGYVVINGWNRDTVTNEQDKITVDLYNTTSSAKTVTVKVEGRYIKSS